MKKKFGETSDVVDAVDKLEKSPDRGDRKATVKTEVEIVKINDDPEILKLAQDLLQQLKVAEPAGDSINIDGGVEGVVATTISGGTINQIFNESPESNKLKKDRLRLIQVVKKEIEDRLAIFKRRNKYINLSLESKPEFVSQIDLLTGKKKQKVDNKELQDIEALFNLFKADVLPQSLLIVGNPASGKSTILCTIAEILLEKAIKDEKQPVPVYLSIRSWDGEPSDIARSF